MNICQLKVLPGLESKQPIGSRFTMYMSQLNGINSPEIMNEAYKTAKAAGCNEIFLPNCSINSLPFGLKKACFFQMEDYAWRWSTLAMRKIYKAFPQSRSKNSRFSKYASISYISRAPETWPLLDEAMRDIRKREPYLTNLIWDYEFRPFAHYADLSPYTLGLFAKNYGIKEKLDQKTIKSKYLEQWQDFRCKELGKISSILKKIANKHNFEFSFYSSGNFAVNRREYSVDIRNLTADRLYLGGYWESRDNMEMVNLSIASKTPQSFSAHMCIGPGTGWQKAVLLRRIILSRGGGILLWYEAGFDAMELHAIADTTRLVADYEKFFIKGNPEAFGINKGQINYGAKNFTPQVIRQSLLGDIKSNKTGLIVYELGNEFLALLINDTSKVENMELKFSKAEGPVKEYYSNKIYRADKKINLSIKPFEVMAFTGKIR